MAVAMILTAATSAATMNIADLLGQCALGVIIINYDVQLLPYQLKWCPTVTSGRHGMLDRYFSFLGASTES